MSEQEDAGGGEKTHDPTDKRLHDARKKGDVVRSGDISTAASYLGIILAIVLLGPAIAQGTAGRLAGFFAHADTFSSKALDSGGRTFVVEAILGAVAPLFPLFAVPAALVLLAVLAQRAFIFAPSKLNMKLSRISLVASAKNKFGMNGLFEFAKSLTKLVVVSLVVVWFLKGNVNRFIGSISGDGNLVALLMMDSLTKLLAIVFISSAIIAAIDYFWQYFSHRRKLMMTRKEVSDEHKENEGDPQLKQKRRQKGYDIATQRMMSDVPSADVIVVNPQHYAVALRWDRDGGGAPVCVAKGVDEIAARIREIAVQNAVPIHRDPPTARAIFATVEIGDEIETEHYKAVAAAIRYAEKIRALARGRVT